MTALLAAEESSAGGPALLIILALAAATALLIVSMLRHLRRVPPSFDRPENERDAGEGHSPR